MISCRASFAAAVLLLAQAAVSHASVAPSSFNVKVGILEATSTGHPAHLLAKRQAGEHYPAKTAIAITGYDSKPLHINLDLDTDFIAKDIKLLDHFSTDNVTDAGAVPRHLLCYYRGKVHGHADSYVTLNMCDSPRGRIELPGRAHLHLEPADSSSESHTHKITPRKARAVKAPSRLHRRNSAAPKILVAKILLAVDIDHVKTLGPWLMGALLGFMHSAATFFPNGVVPVHDNVYVKMQFTHVVRALSRHLVTDSAIPPKMIDSFITNISKNYLNVVDVSIMLRRTSSFRKGGYAKIKGRHCRAAENAALVIGEINEHTAWKFNHEYLHVLGADHVEGYRSSPSCRGSEDVLTGSLTFNSLSECTISDLRYAYENARFSCFETLESASRKKSEIITQDIAGFGGQLTYVKNDRNHHLVIDESLSTGTQPLKWGYISHGIIKNYMKRFFNMWNFNIGKMLSLLTGFDSVGENSIAAFDNSPSLDHYLPSEDYNGEKQFYNTPTNADEFDIHRSAHLNPVKKSTSEAEFQQGNGFNFVEKKDIVDFQKKRQAFKLLEEKRRLQYHRGESLELHPILRSKLSHDNSQVHLPVADLSPQPQSNIINKFPEIQQSSAEGIPQPQATNHRQENKAWQPEISSEVVERAQQPPILDQNVEGATKAVFPTQPEISKNIDTTSSTVRSPKREKSSQNQNQSKSTIRTASSHKKYSWRPTKPSSWRVATVKASPSSNQVQRYIPWGGQMIPVRKSLVVARR